MEAGHHDVIVSPPPPVGPAQGQLRVWIDQDLCTGDGICTDHAPAVFTILEDGIAYVQEDGQALNDPGGPAQLASVPVELEERVVHAAAECPGECIFVELAEPGGSHS
jgi:ferredoxin